MRSGRIPLDIDLYIPIFTILQFFFYMGLLKVIYIYNIQNILPFFFFKVIYIQFLVHNENNELIRLVSWTNSYSIMNKFV